MKRTVWELREGAEYGYYLRQILRSVKGRLDDLLAPYGITNQQARIVGYIFQRHSLGENVRQKDLEEDMGLRGSSITSLLQGLEKRGFVLRGADASDGRAKRLVLTEKGNALHETFRRIFRETEESITAGMTEEERALLLGLLRRAWENLETSLTQKAE